MLRIFKGDGLVPAPVNCASWQKGQSAPRNLDKLAIEEPTNSIITCVVIALPETGLEKALHVAERLRESLAEAPIADESPSLRITVSIGITAGGQSSPELPTLLKQADTALYKAKKRGRNRVEVFAEQSPCSWAQE